MKMAAAVYARQERGGMEVLSLSYYLLYYISNKVDKLGWKKREKMGNERWKTTTTRGSAKRAFSNGIFVVEPANRGWERAQSFHGTYIDSTAGNTQRKPLFFFFFPLYACIRCIIHFSLYLILSSQFVVVPYFETGNCCLEPTDTTWDTAHTGRITAEKKNNKNHVCGSIAQQTATDLVLLIEQMSISFQH